ncbi:MAG TPA: hypothetical protein VKZ18_19530 [Polyangia bacterium]|nr:hypothetical protein [Polyangia bacterium]
MRHGSFLHLVAPMALGAAVALGGAGCGRQLVGVAKPTDLVAWEPASTDPSARITTVSATADWIYAGFTNGDIYSRANAAGATWAPFFVRTGQGACGEPMTIDPVTALAPSVTGLTASQPYVFAAFAGSPGSFKFWRSPADHPCWSSSTIDDDILSVSVSPFSSIDVLAVSPDFLWVSQNFAVTWNDAGDLPVNFGGTVQALAGGIGAGGATRAWLGDAAGDVYYSDDVDTASATAAIAWTRVPNPGFPARPVVAISTRPEHPQTVWVTFAGLSVDSLWTSLDNGATWRNPGGGELASVSQSQGAADAAAGDAQAPAVGASPAGFGVVSPVPGLDAAYVTALVRDRRGVVTATPFWTLEGSDEWWRQ